MVQLKRCELSPSEIVKELCWLMLGSTMEMLMHLIIKEAYSVLFQGSSCILGIAQHG